MSGKVAMDTNFIKLTFILNISYDPLLVAELFAILFDSSNMKSFTSEHMVSIVKGT